MVSYDLGRMSRIECVEIIPYHRFGESKRERFGLDGLSDFRAEAPDQDTIVSWVDQLRRFDVRVTNNVEPAPGP